MQKECKTCGESPEAHIFHYTHHNKLLTIQVRCLPMDKGLRGEHEGKLWMWSRCCKCKSQDGRSLSTKRVLISTGSRGFSFGKFLELSFSNSSFFSGLSACGHSFDKDFLYFFGYEHFNIVLVSVICEVVCYFLYICVQWLLPIGSCCFCPPFSL